jgi:quinolinate synthase
MLEFARQTDRKQIILGTETGIIHRLKKENPDKTFIALSEQGICTDMKKVLLEDVLASLENMQHQIELDEKTIACAKTPILRMIEGKLDI